MRGAGKGKIWLLGAGLLLVLAGGFFLLMPYGVEAPDEPNTKLNLGRSALVSPIEQVAVKPEAGSQKSEGVEAQPTVVSRAQPSPTLSRAQPSPTINAEFSRGTPSPASLLPTLTPVSRLFPVRVEAPAARINAPIVESYLDQNSAIYVPLYEAGHYINSARPGEKGNMVIVGHVRRGMVFNRLINLKLNDLVSVYNEAGQRFDYKVAQIELLPAAGASAEQIQAGLLYTSPTSDERISLITCYPETSYANRLVVIGVPVRPGEVAR